jgi:RimJ/RimL family protein N-acetyltransferase
VTEQVRAVEPVQIFRDPGVQCWNPGPDPEDENAVRAWCEGAGDWSRGGHASFSVLDSASGLLLGTVAVHRNDPRSGDAEIGYRVAPAARGRRVAKRQSDVYGDGVRYDEHLHARLATD